MIRIQLTLIAILLCCFVLASCEYTSNVLRPDAPNTDDSTGSTDDSYRKLMTQTTMEWETPVIMKRIWTCRKVLPWL